MADDGTKQPATIGDIKIAMLESTIQIKDHITSEMKDMKTCTNDKFDDLPCGEHHDDLKKNAANHKLLVVVLCVTGVLGGTGGVYGGLKVASYFTSLMAGG